MCFLSWFRHKIVSTLQPKGSTPLNWGVTVALFFSMFGNAISMQMLFAFLPDMVKSFGIADEDAGFYVGLLASAVFLGRFLSSYFWGWLSDKIGRRQVLLWCLFLLAATSLSFGFAKSFAVALFIRFFTGLIAGVAGTVKAAVAETCDDSNQALGMSVIVTAWNSGLIIGPAVGGYLAKPASKYSAFKESKFFQNFAYVLPCLVNTAVVFLSFLLIYFKLPETLPAIRDKKERGLVVVVEVPRDCLEDQVDSNQSPRKRSMKTSLSLNDLPNNRHLGNQDLKPAARSSDFQFLPSGSVSIIPDLYLQNVTQISSSLNDVKDGKRDVYVPTSCNGKPGAVRKAYEAARKSKLLTLCRNKDVRLTIGLYMVFSFATIAEHEMYSVWAATGRRFGGLNFDTNDLGFTLMVVGIGCVLSNCFVFPQLVKVCGHLKTQQILLTGVMFFTIVLPCTNALTDKTAELKITVIAVLLMLRVNQGCSFTGQFIFIGNSVTSNLRATAHGLAMTMTCLARTISPTVAGSLFSWSITSGLGFPFNEKCVFIYMGFIYWISLVISCCLDKNSVSKQKD